MRLSDREVQCCAHMNRKGNKISVTTVDRKEEMLQRFEDTETGFSSHE